MNDYNPIKLTPYLARSKNLIEFFGIVGYNEKILSELAPNILKDKTLLQVSLLSAVFSDNPCAIFNPKEIIRKTYLNGEITEICYEDQKPPQQSQGYFIFSYLNSLNRENKILYYCNILKFYEIFKTTNSSYYIPKAFVIYSQYPNINSIGKIMIGLLDYHQNRNKKNIPIEVIINCLLNYIPSPLNYKLNLNIFPDRSKISIPQLMGYNYIGYDLFERIKKMSINDIIITFVFTFLEIPLIFFSPDLVKLNMAISTFQSFNFPLIDSQYYWYINVLGYVGKEEESLNHSFRGLNMEFNKENNKRLNSANYRDLYYIVDLEKGELKNIRNEKNNVFEEYYKIYQYLIKILKNNNVKSSFLQKYLIDLKKKIEIEKKEKDIVRRNIEMQDAFYHFILKILSIGYRDYKYNKEKTQVVKKLDDAQKMSEEEKIFIRLFRNMKYSTYFEKYIQKCKVSEELKTSFFLTDLFIHLIMKDEENSNNINFLDLINEIYSYQEELNIDFKDLSKEYEKIRDNKIIKKMNTGQLIVLNKHLINLYLYYIKNKTTLYSSKFKEIIEKDLFTKNKIYLLSALEMKCLEKKIIISAENILYNSIIYIFAIVFPFFKHEKIKDFLKHILDNFNKIIFKKHFISILLNSINNYYCKNNGQFPELILNNIEIYFNLLKEYICENNILYDEFLKKILFENNKNIINNKDENDLVFKYKEDYEDNIDNIVDKDQNKNELIFNYKGKTEKYNLYLETDIFYGQVLLTYEKYIKYNYDVRKYEKTNDIIELIVNMIYFLKKYKNNIMIGYLLNAIILLKKFETDLSEYNENKKKDNEDKNNIINENNNNNQNIINIENNKNN